MPTAPSPASPRTSRLPVELVAVVVWAALILIAIVWGRWLSHRYPLDLGAPPFWSPWRRHVSARVVPALAVGGTIVWFGPRVALTLSWRRLLAAVASASALWCVAVAYVDNLDGIDAVTDPTRFSRNDYLQTARGIHSLRHFLSHMLDHLAIYPQHSKGHPPGMIVIEWLLDHLNLTSDPMNAVLVVAGGCAAGVAALVALRSLAGEDAARAAAPFMVLVPAVIWWQTADAFFTGVSAWSITAVVLAAQRRDTRGDVLALVGGFGFGVTMFLSYGLVLIALVPLVVCASLRRLRPLVLAAVGALPVFAFFALMGFSWFAGLRGTRHEYLAGVAIHRPYWYFLVADIALLAAATGPAVAAALTRVRARGVWLLSGSMLAVVALADVSGMSKAEVERIWLPFVPWVVCATAALAPRAIARARWWLVAQVACTFAIALTIWSQW